MTGEDMFCSSVMTRIRTDKVHIRLRCSSDLFMLMLWLLLDDPPIQRCFSYDEKPLQVWTWLRAKGKHPAFMIKHVNEIKSPITVIRERHAERQASLRSGGAVSGIGHRNSNAHPDVRDSVTTTENTVSARGASYAVAIFPYWAEAADELDVNL